MFQVICTYFVWLCGPLDTPRLLIYVYIWRKHRKFSKSLVLLRPLRVTYKGLIQLFFSSQQEENIFMVNGLLK